MSETSTGNTTSRNVGKVAQSVKRSSEYSWLANRARFDPNFSVVILESKADLKTRVKTLEAEVKQLKNNAKKVEGALKDIFQKLAQDSTSYQRFLYSVGTFCDHSNKLDQNWLAALDLSLVKLCH